VLLLKLLPIRITSLIGPATLSVCFALFLLHPAAALDQVSLQLKWKHQFQFAGYYAALEQGLYRNAGLDVTIREGEPISMPPERLPAARRISASVRDDKRQDESNFSTYTRDMALWLYWQASMS
jgi:hypothetical protein